MNEEHALNDGLRFVIIVDESHQNNTIKADEIIQYFHTEKKDIEDLPDLKPFCPANALNRAYKGQKGFAAAFSARSTSSDDLIDTIKARSDFKSLLCYEEIILVAVNI